MCFSCSLFRRLNNLLVHHMLFSKLCHFEGNHILNYKQVRLTKWITNAKADKPLCVRQFCVKWLWLHRCQWIAQRGAAHANNEAITGARFKRNLVHSNLDKKSLRWPSWSAPSTSTQPLSNRLSKAAEWINSSGVSGAERGWRMKYNLPVSVRVLCSAP